MTSHIDVTRYLDLAVSGKVIVISLDLMQNKKIHCTCSLRYTYHFGIFWTIIPIWRAKDQDGSLAVKPGASKGRPKAGGVEGVLLVVGIGRNNARSGEDLLYSDAT